MPKIHPRTSSKRTRWREIRETGYLSAGRLWAMPVRLHVAMLLILPLFLVSSRGGLTYFLQLLLIVLIHELGHGVLVRLYGRAVQSIDLGPWGGVCRYDGKVTPLQDAVIAWGGVVAQALLQLCIVAAVHLLSGKGAHEASAWLRQLAGVNVGIIVFNLLPVPPLDGATAWRLVPLLWRRRGRGASKPRKASKLPHDAHLRVVHDALEQAKREAQLRKGRREGEN